MECVFCAIITLMFAALLTMAAVLSLTGEITGPSKHAFQWISIESIDRRFVEYGEIDSDAKFQFKKLPEGLYKITIGGSARPEEQRTIEVRQAFADSRGRVKVKIEPQSKAPTGERFKVGVNALGVSPKAVEELRKAYDARGDIEKARRHLQNAIEISPNFVDALNNLGTIYYHEGRFDKAAELFERGVKANPDSYPSQVNLGGALISLGNYDGALAQNRTAVQMRPNDSLAQSQLGQTLFHLQRYDEALTHLEAAKRIDPMSFTLPGYFIARIHETLGRKEAAIAEYREFLSVHPSHEYTPLIQTRLRFLEGR